MWCISIVREKARKLTSSIQSFPTMILWTQQLTLLHVYTSLNLQENVEKWFFVMPKTWNNRTWLLCCEDQDSLTWWPIRQGQITEFSCLLLSWILRSRAHNRSQVSPQKTSFWYISWLSQLSHFSDDNVCWKCSVSGKWGVFYCEHFFNASFFSLQLVEKRLSKWVKILLNCATTMDTHKLVARDREKTCVAPS